MAKQMCFIQYVKKGGTPAAGSCKKSRSLSDVVKPDDYLFRAFSESKFYTLVGVLMYDI